MRFPRRISIQVPDTMYRLEVSIYKKDCISEPPICKVRDSKMNDVADVSLTTFEILTAHTKLTNTDKRHIFSHVFCNRYELTSAYYHNREYGFI